MKTSRGFTIIEAVIIVVFVAILSLLGLVAYNQFFGTKTTTTADSSTTTTETVTKVESTSDLDKATTDLDSIDLTDSDDTTTLDSETADF
ncbi:MAG: hypothetical protein WAO28_02135 [Candidatus Microsaccharimonas sp.]